MKCRTYLIALEYKIFTSLVPEVNLGDLSIHGFRTCIMSLDRPQGTLWNMFIMKRLRGKFETGLSEHKQWEQPGKIRPALDKRGEFSFSRAEEYFF
jgi:hypothetical protein